MLIKFLYRYLRNNVEKTEAVLNLNLLILLFFILFNVNVRLYCLNLISDLSL